MKKICFILIVAVGLAGCATSLDGERYRSVGPSFDLFEFFNGTVRAWGLVQDRGGEVVQKFEVKIRGTVAGNQITLDETFRYAIGTGPKNGYGKLTDLITENTGVSPTICWERRLGCFTVTLSVGHIGWRFRSVIPCMRLAFRIGFGRLTIGAY